VRTLEPINFLWPQLSGQQSENRPDANATTVLVSLPFSAILPRAFQHFHNCNTLPKLVDISTN
jgi:hypothetical protein